MSGLSDAELVAALELHQAPVVLYYALPHASPSDAVALDYSVEHALGREAPVMFWVDVERAPGALNALPGWTGTLPTLALTSGSPHTIRATREGPFDRPTLNAFVGLPSKPAPRPTPPASPMPAPGQAPPTLPGSSPNKPDELPAVVVLGALAALWYFFK